jgi:hypothetical protein
MAAIVANEYALNLDWIPVAKKSRFHAMYSPKLKRVLQFPDKLVVKDTAAIRSILAGGPRPSDTAFRSNWAITIIVQRPLSKAEAADGHTNRRRGDLVSAHELVLDALQGFWYDDDSQVTALHLYEQRTGQTASLNVRGVPRP